MEINWTPEQSLAITTTGKNILVSAAAGSGKTAVLVERIIRMICDTQNPVSVDKLLVLTYTEAAASEMRRKIAVAIENKLDELPNDPWLKEQSLKVGSASISTVHAFCKRIISNNVHLTDLPSDFSLIDDTENKIMQASALDSVLDSYYSRIDKRTDFRDLATGWGGIKGDDSLREMLISLHNFTRSLAYPKKWLYNIRKNGYEIIKKNNSLENSIWYELFIKKLYSHTKNIADGLNIIWNIVDNNVPKDHKFYTYYFDMKESFCPLFNKIDVTSSDILSQLSNLVLSMEIKNSPRKTGLDEMVAARISSLRDSLVKAELTSAKELLNAFSQEGFSLIGKCTPVVNIICSIIRQTEKVHQRLKKAKGVIDFSDLEYGLLNLLVNQKGEDTPLCLALREHYHEILLDEFQDTNVLQFEIFKRLSKKQGNLFMVGDVKQCIYKFRNSDPSIFMNLYKAYDKNDGGCLIRLFKNFRSRKEIIDSANYIFSTVMSEDLGGVDYTQDEHLEQGATYPVGDTFDTEILITDRTEPLSYDSAIEDIDALQLEARNVASKIYSLICIDKIKVTDKDGSFRDATYGDITVLCRSNKECNEVESELARIGIASLCDSGRQYLDSLEVTTVLSFLQIIDNPLQDIPLIAVMRSAMFRFTADELAKIRIYSKGYFYNALVKSAEENEKSKHFLSVLLDLRKSSRHMGTDELVWKICNEQNYFSIVEAMPNGDIRHANLRLLLKRCSDFEQGSMTGLFNFIKYIESLKENHKDLVPAKEMVDTENSVNIMTIHRSKGLEFPIVFMFRTGKSFDTRDLNKSVIWEEKSGIGLDYIDTRQRVKFSTPSRRLVASEILSSFKSEEMRLMYVAITRAKEKLIISASITTRGNGWATTEFDHNNRLYPIMAKNISCMRDWIFASLLTNPCGKELRERADRFDIIPRINSDAIFNITFANQETDSSLSTSAIKFDVDKSLNDMVNRLNYIYPHKALSTLPIKLSVSELKRRNAPEEDYSINLLNIPQKLSPKAYLTGAEKGTVTHFVLQHLNIKETDTLDQIEAQILQMTQKGIITVAQQKGIDINSIFSFFQSDLGKRLKLSKKVEREFDFYMLISPAEVDKNINSDKGDNIIIQGIADCLFYEDDGIVLIDYKTDRINDTELASRSKFYKTQIDYYARGLSDVLKMPVKEKYLYFLSCQKAIKM